MTEQIITGATAKSVYLVDNTGQPYTPTNQMQVQTTVKAGTATIGATSNDGTNNTAIAAALNSTTVIKAAPGRLASVLVTTTGSNAMTFYDNATTPAGTVIAIIPASATVGQFFSLKVPAMAGITVAGSLTNPGVTVFWS